ncbi:GntR family transcriptional regulator [Victivallis sp. Marseille-Q1083]|uniref:GntR family transcriptional regulator n=1 Tax=Victivallis sp. Marseille-Q1083 TaxID=2717288 RepID=UPI00158E7221|nr:GntR family transcriptional regulator [Victivallis sp. Marseille-Q1083]
MFGENLGRQTESIKQSILSYLWDNQLAVGDKIPAQAELCRRFNVGSTSVHRAVQALGADGVLEPRRNVGVFVREARPTSHPGRSIALLVLQFDQLYMFHWTLAHMLQNILRQNGCLCTMYPCRHNSTPPENSDFFPGLKSAIGKGAIDGVITLLELDPKLLDELRQAGLEAFFVGSPMKMPSGVFIDVGDFIRRALEELLDNQAKRLAVLGWIGEVNFPLETILQEFNSRHRDLPEIMLYKAYDLEGGQKFARTLLNLAPEERPDGVVLCDDIMALGFTSELIRQQWRRQEYLPQIVVMRNRQIKVNMPYRETGIYEVDIQALSELAVSTLLRKFRDGDHSDHTIWLHTERLKSQETNEFLIF